jgi:prepilin-type N-terminal cleavage/methylation domain-containing protein
MKYEFIKHAVTAETFNHKGYTLIELMIALALSMLLLLGVFGSYSSISGTIRASQELENSQEVIRYSAQVFTRSLKQSLNPAAITNLIDANIPDVGTGLVVTLPANAKACFGPNPPAVFVETYNFVAPNLTCSIDGAPPVTLLTGIANMQFIAAEANLITIRVSPIFLSQNFPEGSIDIDVALSARIFSNVP